MIKDIPRPLAVIIGEVIGGYYYHHQSLEVLFYKAGASGDVPEGNCIKKVTDWLVREGKANLNNSLSILGKVLEEFMDGDIQRSSRNKEEERESITSALARYGLAYGFGGRIFGASVTAPSRTLGDKLKEVSIAEIEDEFERAHRTVDTDPPTAVTAACAIVEALCKTYISDNNLALPSKHTIGGLWKIVSKHLRLSPDSVEEADLKRILSGLTSITDGIGAFRTHAGSAHGHSNRSYRIEPRHARVAVHSAHTLCLFVLETWLARKSEG